MTAESWNSLTIDMAISRQRRGKHVSAAMNKHTIMEEFLEAIFSVWSVPWLYSGGSRQSVMSRKSVIASNS
jgi:hypothetical protein